MKLVSLAALAALAACARPSVSDLLARATWVDLTYDFDSTTIYWPTAKPFRLEVVSAQRTAAGYYYAANNIAAAEHGAPTSTPRCTSPRGSTRPIRSPSP